MSLEAFEKAIEQKPEKEIKRIELMKKGENHPLRMRFTQFEVDGYAYEVEQILKKFRILVKLLGHVELSEDGKKIVPVDFTFNSDPLADRDFVFRMEGIIYKVNNIRGSRRTLKCIGKPVYKGE